MLTVVFAMPCNTHFQGKASIIWDKFGTSPRQAINRGLMNYLGMVGSDTGSPSILVGLFATLLEKPCVVKAFRPISNFRKPIKNVKFFTALFKKIVQISPTLRR